MATYLSPGVYVEEVDRGGKPIEGVGTAVAAFVGFTAKAPKDDPDDLDGVRPRLVTNWMQYEKLFGGFVDGALLPHAVYGYFNNGGGRAYIVRIPHSGGGTASAPPRAALPSGTRRDLETLDVRALEADQALVVVIEADEQQEGGEESSSPTFTLKVHRDGQEIESFPDLTFGKSGRNVETIVNAESQLIQVRAPSLPGVRLADRLPASGRYRLAAQEAEPVDAAELEGSESTRTGIRGLVIADEVTMIAVPDLVTAATQPDGSTDLEMFKAVQSKLIEHCEATKDRMAILDAPPGMDPQRVSEWRENEAMYDSNYAALYYPWIKVDNPLARADDTNSRTIPVPPSGHMAGIWARNDDTRGVWKAPANEVVRGARDVVTKVTKGEQDLLNPLGINCIRPFGIPGIRVWGARTLSSDASWRYINVRRLFNYIEESIERGTQWVVFEPNDQNLWQRVKRTLFSFLYGLWQDGALVGANPDQAFFIKCDEENNPPSEVEKGMLTIDVGVAASRPAEFVVIHISQWQGAELAAS